MIQFARLWPRPKRWARVTDCPPLEVLAMRSCPWWASWSVGWYSEWHRHEWQVQVQLGPVALHVTRVH